MPGRYRRPMGSVRWTKLARESQPLEGCLWGSFLFFIKALGVALLILSPLLIMVASEYLSAWSKDFLLNHPDFVYEASIRIIFYGTFGIVVGAIIVVYKYRK